MCTTQLLVTGDSAGYEVASFVICHDKQAAVGGRGVGMAHKCQKDEGEVRSRLRWS